MNAATILIICLIAVFALVACGWSVRTIWREMMGIGEGTEAEGQRAELRKNARIKKQLEHWRNGE